MYWRKILLSFLILLLIGSCSMVQAQQINWLSFEQLEDSLEVRPKKVFIGFYTEWCTYCRKMDKEVFTNPAVVEVMNNDYYAVKLNAETLDTIRFDGQLFINRQSQKQRNGIHELALLLGQRGQVFVAPTIILLDENFRMNDRHFEYLDSKRLLQIFKKNAQRSK